MRLRHSRCDRDEVDDEWRQHGRASVMHHSADPANHDSSALLLHNVPGNMASMPAPGQRLRVAIVAPSLRILGGQSVQADALRRAWSADADVEPVFVPVNPQPPRGLRWLLAIKYLRTLITELIYLPQLVRKLSQVDVAHVFSASYSSFLLAPLPAILVARWFNKPVVLNYHSGEAADHLRRSKLARAILARVDR